VNFDCHKESYLHQHELELLRSLINLSELHAEHVYGKDIRE